MTFVPAGSELRFHPKRISTDGDPPSIFHRSTDPSGFFTSICSQECGFHLHHHDLALQRDLFVRVELGGEGMMCGGRQQAQPPKSLLSPSSICCAFVKLPTTTIPSTNYSIRS